MSVNLKTSQFIHLKNKQQQNHYILTFIRYNAIKYILHLTLGKGYVFEDVKAMCCFVFFFLD